jgi:YD repeat-containing protein
VWEDPAHWNYVTGYGYDALDDLVWVWQSGQTRSFAYDSLGRMTQATNPESGTTNYTYDGNGNLLTRTDARNITTTYQYDSLNRPMQISYNDGTSTVYYTYDMSGANSAGRLTQVANSASASNYTGYDALGRVTGSNQLTAGQSYSFSYSYNLAGALARETYPSGRVITTGYDGANRVNGVTGTLWGQNTNYVSNVSYAPHGAPYTYSYGNTVWPGVTYNSRLQPTQIYGTVNSDGNQFMYYLWYYWGSTNNNGNVQYIDELVGDKVPWDSMTRYDQGFSYDGLNRLTSVSDSGGYGRSFRYDPFGNAWVSGLSGVGYGPATPAGNVYRRDWRWRKYCCGRLAVGWRGDWKRQRVR